MTACPFLLSFFLYPRRHHHESENALKIAPKTGFFYCLDSLHGERANAPKNRQRNGKNGKQGNGATAGEYATPKKTPLNRPKTNESNADGQTLTESKSARKWAQKHAKTKNGKKHRHEARTNATKGDKRSRATSNRHRAKPRKKGQPKPSQKRGVPKWVCWQVYLPSCICRSPSVVGYLSYA